MGMNAPLATPDLDETTLLEAAPLEPWEVVVWNDPVNLMSYVVRVFRTYFGYSTDRATTLMLAVHHDGHAIVATGPRETMEVHAQAMHDYGLWATVRKATP
ncbi:ATP-dependent Clp protease adapter protein ClpS [Microbacterium oxydans]|uniref:ATP-dependent Clp protease adapter protein ClpS n=2 Tax=Microbacterium oxydans TaxID=82380 RepID=A0A0F0L6T8_9MICO|nr:ATP-dependent Clp protease adapter ClpS [Microbacterium oxydans]KJL28030.1 ATP-dependent Clp protease adapter protein ClpS [Microbacterium oxydans]CAH0143026.1 ATP-dependent Clp protease adapter protein ClpS [Microbacterium oxydans]